MKKAAIDRELKRSVRQAFAVPEPEGRQAFMKKLDKRERCVIGRTQFFLIQLSYIRKRIWTASALLFGAAVAAAYTFQKSTAAGDMDQVLLWCISAVTPFLVLLSVAEAGRSASCGMRELEMSTRYHLPEIYLARMFFLGCGNAIEFLIAVILLRNAGQESVFMTSIYLLVPYLLTISLSLWVAGRLESSHMMFGVLVSACTVAVTYVLLWGANAQIYDAGYEDMWLLVFAAICYFAVKQLSGEKKAWEEIICS